MRAFQRRHRLAVDGIVGPRTRRALGRYGRHLLGSRVLGRGQVGWDVAALQFILAAHGFPSGPFDGIFGPHLRAAAAALPGLRRYPDRRSRRAGDAGCAAAAAAACAVRAHVAAAGARSPARSALAGTAFTPGSTLRLRSARRSRRPRRGGSHSRPSTTGTESSSSWPIPGACASSTRTCRRSASTSVSGSTWGLDWGRWGRPARPPGRTSTSRYASAEQPSTRVRPCREARVEEADRGGQETGGRGRAEPGERAPDRRHGEAGQDQRRYRAAVGGSSPARPTPRRASPASSRARPGAARGRSRGDPEPPESPSRTPARSAAPRSRLPPRPRRRRAPAGAPSAARRAAASRARAAAPSAARRTGSRRGTTARPSRAPRPRRARPRRARNSRATPTTPRAPGRAARATASKRRPPSRSASSAVPNASRASTRPA